MRLLSTVQPNMSGRKMSSEIAVGLNSRAIDNPAVPRVARSGRASSWVTTGDVARAAGVSEATIHRWAKLGVLPPHRVHSGGARGRVAMWPADAPKQAVWVLKQLEALRSWEDIRAALAAGEFRPDEG